MIANLSDIPNPASPSARRRLGLRLAGGPLPDGNAAAETRTVIPISQSGR